MYYDLRLNFHQNGKDQTQNFGDLICNTDYKYDIKFTVLINVSEEKYSGGKFKLMHGGKPEHVKELDEPGNMIMFRSYTLHKVEPVTKGERKTLTLFLTGPNFK